MGNTNRCIAFFRYKKLWKRGSPLVYVIQKDYVSTNSVVYTAEANGRYYSVKAIRVAERGVLSKLWNVGFECVSSLLERLKKKRFSPLEKRTKDYLKRKQRLVDKSKVIEEIYLLKAAQHRYVIRYFDYFQSDNFIWIISELAFTNLAVVRRAVEDKRGLRLIEYQLIYFLMAPVIDALAHIHEVGIIHMDIKEENILIMHNGTPKLTDFGLAKINPGIEVHCEGEGTGVYRAPEILIFEEPFVTPAADVWSLGMTFQSLVFGNQKSSELEPLLNAYKTGKEERVWQHTALENHRFNTKEDNEYRDFIRKVLVFDPVKRLSSRALRGFDWVERMCLIWRKRTKEDSEEFEKNMSLLQKRFDYINGNS